MHGSSQAALTLAALTAAGAIVLAVLSPGPTTRRSRASRTHTNTPPRSNTPFS